MITKVIQGIEFEIDWEGNGMPDIEWVTANVARSDQDVYDLLNDDIQQKIYQAVVEHLQNRPEPDKEEGE
jgi:hypothetical protein